MGFVYLFIVEIDYDGISQSDQGAIEQWIIPVFWIRLDLIGLDWIGLGWIGLD